MALVLNPQKQVASSCLEYLLLALVQQYKKIGDENGWDENKLHTKLQEIGEHLGIRILEKLVKDHARFNRELDIIKFLCKDFWNHCFNNHKLINYKQIIKELMSFMIHIFHGLKKYHPQIQSVQNHQIMIKIKINQIQIYSKQKLLYYI